MKHSDFTTAVQALAESILGAGAATHVSLRNESPILSATNPALRFRIGLQAPAQTAAQLMTTLAGRVGISGSQDSLQVQRAVERAIAAAMNMHRPWSDLGLGQAHIVLGSVAIAADPDVLLFDYRFSPTSYEPEA